MLAPNRFPRRVVDSSVSGVTAHTCIPNCMCLPRISDVISAAPDIPPSLLCTLQVQSEVVWIGWQISTLHWTVTLTTDKREAILADLDELLRVHKVLIKLLQKLTGKLLWGTMGYICLAPIAPIVERFLACNGSSFSDSGVHLTPRMGTTAEVIK